MIWDRRGARRRSNDAAGMTLVEAVVAGVVLLAALLFLLWAAGPAATRARGEACSRKLRGFYQAVFYYISRRFLRNGKRPAKHGLGDHWR